MIDLEAGTMLISTLLTRQEEGEAQQDSGTIFLQWSKGILQAVAVQELIVMELLLHQIAEIDLGHLLGRLALYCELVLS